MGIVLDTPKQVTTVREMVDGDVAVILSWTYTDPSVVGYVVQRVDNALVALGKSSRKGWPALFDGLEFNDSALQVRILEDGEKLTIKDNS